MECGGQEVIYAYKGTRQRENGENYIKKRFINYPPHKILFG